MSNYKTSKILNGCSEGITFILILIMLHVDTNIVHMQWTMAYTIFVFTIQASNTFNDMPG